MFRTCSGLSLEQSGGNQAAAGAVQRNMIFLDTDTEFLVATTRREMVSALINHFPTDPDDTDLAALAAACLGVEEMDVVVLET